MRIIHSLLAGLALLLVAACTPARDEARGPLVLAASSLQDALSEVGQSWMSNGHPEPVLSFAATSALARQIEAGAPADLFVSADEQWMDDLQAKGLIRANSRRDLLGNALVIVAPAKNAKGIEPLDIAALAGALGKGRLAIADPQAVPAGRYAKEALTSIGGWNSVQSRVIPAENVRAALMLVARREASLGIVYASDAAAEPGVRVVYAFAPESHAPIVYPAAQLTASTNGDAQEFFAYLSSNEAAAIFRKHGFLVRSAP